MKSGQHGIIKMLLDATKDIAEKGRDGHGNHIMLSKKAFDYLSDRAIEDLLGPSAAEVIEQRKRDRRKERITQIIKD
jgi:PHD/YefM family antitoxin component YafN of YafNO toxin-antitoxin module